MPFDKNGVQLRPGNIVTIHAKVVSVDDTDDFNNLVCETLEENFPSNSFSIIILNARQVQKVG